MPAVNGPVVRAGEDFGADAAHQEGAVAVGEITPADASLHEGIAAEEALGGVLDKDEAIWRVPGDVGEAEVAADGADFAGPGEDLVHGVIFHGIIHPGPLFELGFQAGVWGGGPPGADGAVVLPGQAGGVHYVIEVPVRQEQGVDAEAAVLEPGGESFGGIDGEVPVRSAEEVAVGGGEAAGVDQEGVGIHPRSHGESDGLFKAIRDVLAKSGGGRRLAESVSSAWCLALRFHPPSSLL